MLGLTSLGTVHTLISIVAVIAGAFALVRDKRITSRNTIGKVYVVTTALTGITALFIFQHGGFNKAHVLAILTLVALVVAAVSEYSNFYGRFSAAIATVTYSATFLFHWIPAVTETTTRLPLGAPLIADRESPILQAAAGVLFFLFLIGAVLQVRALRGGRAIAMPLGVGSVSNSRV